MSLKTEIGNVIERFLGAPVEELKRFGLAVCFTPARGLVMEFAEGPVEKGLGLGFNAILCPEKPV